MNNLYQWAARWNVPMEAIAELREDLGLNELTAPEGATTETGAAQRMRLEASHQGAIMWRNNVGAYQDERGVQIRYGLANESKAMNKRIKSSDYIGIRPVTITPEMVGDVIGQFVARETKKPGWTYSGTKRETAQNKFLWIVFSHGGDARFSTGEF